MPISISNIEPRLGLSSGGDLVTIQGDLPDRVGVWFGDRSAHVEEIVPDPARPRYASSIQVRTPVSAPALVDVTVWRLDEANERVLGEVAQSFGAFRFQRVRLGIESDLTRVVRSLLRELKRQVLQNTSIAVSVEFPEEPEAVLSRVARATLPSLVLSGPRLRENREYSTNELGEEVVIGLAGPSLRRRRPPLTVDLEFGVTLASDRAAEMLNLQAALASFVHRNRWIAMPRDPTLPDGPIVGWELDPVGELRPLVEGTEHSDLRAFTWGLVIRGFDLAEDQLLDVHREVERAGEVSLEPLA